MGKRRIASWPRDRPATKAGEELGVEEGCRRGSGYAFDPTTGEFLRPLREPSGQPINIDNVWAIQFGHDGGPGTAHNQLFFTAGPDNYGNGLFGVITVAP